MKKEDKLETIEFKLDTEAGGLLAVSIVTDPAIEKTFKLFNKEEKQNFKNLFDKFSKTDEEKMEITGPVMIPNLEILRKTKSGTYYNCIFSEDTVKECAEFFLKNSNHTQANFEHNEDSFTDKVFVSESWIVVDPEMDKSKALAFSDVTKSTWFMTYKVTDKELWSSIKENGFTGFSIEAFFDTFEKQIDERFNKENEKIDFIKAILNSSMNDIEKEHIIRKYIGTV